MKHYYQVQEQYANTNDTVKLFAPFDGKVVNIAHTDAEKALCKGQYQYQR